jgi:hypothetical protein
LAISILISKGAHSSCCGFSFTSYKDWQRSDEKFGIDSQWRGEQFWIIIFYFSLGKAAIFSAPLEIAQKVFYRDWLGRNRDRDRDLSGRDLDVGGQALPPQLHALPLFFFQVNLHQRCAFGSGWIRI